MVVDTKSKAQVFRCDGEDLDCKGSSPHWIAVTPDGYVTTWASWHRAMQRAVMGW